MRRGWTTLLLALLTVMLLAFGCADKFVTSGKIAMNSRNYDKAIGDFNKALEVNPNNAQAHFYLAKAYKEKGDFAQMAGHLDAAEKLDPKLKTELEKLRDDAWYAAAGSADSSMNEVPVMEKDANAYFEKALEQQGGNQADSATRYFNLTKASLRIHDNDPAQTLFNQAVDKAKAGQIEDARLLFADSVMLAATRGIYENAKNEFEIAILISPNRPEAYAKAGFAWFRLANDDSSFYYYDKAHTLAPENFEILRNMVKVADLLGKLDLVDTLYAQTLQKDPNNVEALVRRGDIAYKADRIDDAIAYYNKALALKADQCNVWFDLGVIYFKKMQTLDTTSQAFTQSAESAEQAFTQAANICPDDINTLINLNVILISNRKYDEAISRLTAFTDKNPKECVGWDLLSQALLRKGQQDKALEADKKYKDCKSNQGQ
jgi:tetratricopeptide (TPR) repeat protein